MSPLVWILVLAYPVGNLVLWHRVDRERVPQPDDAYGDPDRIGVWRPPPGTLTPLGWRRWRVARRFTILGFVWWVAFAVFVLIS